MLEGKDKQGDQTDEAQGNDVFVNPETGTVTINATSREHAKIQEYLDRVAAGARRQVLIEATIVEVALNNQYQAGIDWKIFKNAANGTPQDNRLNVTQTSTSDTLLQKLPYTLLTYTKSASGLLNGADISATVKALETFGKTKVLSSPKIMALNNQTAVLKVVDEKVYFTLKLDIQAAAPNSPETRTWTSELHTLPVGMVMSVTPQIGENDTVSLNIRPTISRITGYKEDPAVAIIQANSSTSAQTVQSLVPEIQVREVESTLRLASNETAVLGGLIQDQVQNQRDGVPLASRLPWGIGDLFSARDDTATKTELVIFLRPVVVHDPSLNGDLRDYKQYLPQDDFFRRKEDEISAFPSGLTAH
jgi:general secretion pathway protein D